MKDLIKQFSHPWWSLSLKQAFEKHLQLEADLKQEAERHIEIVTGLNRANHKLNAQLKSSNNIREHEKKILINEIDMNHNLKSTLRSLIAATEEIIRISDRKHNAWTNAKIIIRSAKEILNK